MDIIKDAIWVGIGGCLGSILRYLISVWAIPYQTGPFPLSTFVANITGCMLMGSLVATVGMTAQPNQTLRFLLMIGFCGGYTTFSAFSVETLTLLSQQQYGLAIGYITASVMGGVLAVAAGYALFR